jgi:glycosyltransferase involved in cell wall biosynthesis
MQKICIVVPCYNEALRLDLAEFDRYLRKDTGVDFLFSNDGSTDGTLEILEKFRNANPERVFIHNLKENSGKAEAVRSGLIKICDQGQYEYVGFWDADLATPLEEIDYFFGQLVNAGRKIAIGSRMKRLGATVERKGMRHFLGRVFSTFSSMILKLPVYDSQCGAKIFKSELSVLFSEKFLTSWLFDVELIARYRNRFGIESALNNILEVPVNTWREKGGSKLKLRHMLKVPFELFIIHSKYN